MVRPNPAARDAGGIRSIGSLAFRSALWTSLFAALVAACALGGWRGVAYVQSRVREQERFRVALGDVQVTPLPVWIHGNVLEEVRYLARLPDHLNTLDPHLAANLRDAFALHPWVREVIEVRISHPAVIRVKLAYREPVAVVRTASAFEPVDREGVLLPRQGFANAELYATITGVRSTPTGPAGTRWDDAAVLAGALTAEALAPHHRTLGVQAVDVSNYRPTPGSSGFIYLLTQQGTRVHWGHPPGADYPGEVSTADKIERLVKYVSENRSLDLPDGPYDIDVTHLDKPTRQPHRLPGRVR
jgi:hypothetical protein